MPGFSAEPLGGDVYTALYRDLTDRPSAVGRFFPLDPSAEASWQRRAETATALWSTGAALARRQALIAALGAFHDRLGATPAQRRQLEALARPDALVVVTGQQAGLLGGPLYTAYKALGAVIRAAQAERALGVPVVPVFWVASEDHDFSEVSQAEVAGPDGRLVRLRLEGGGDFRSAGNIPLPAEARRLVGQLMTLFPPTALGRPAAEDLLAGLRRPGRVTLADWFTWQLHRLLGSRGLLLYDPMLPGLRALAAPIFAEAAAKAPSANRRIAEAAAALAGLGYAPGLDLDPDHSHLFIYHQGRRLALHLNGDRVCTRDGKVDMSATELTARAAAEPTAFSPNVALRPIVQDFTLPVLTQLGGPGEVAYLAQLTTVFELWDRSAPIVTPRPGATLALEADLAALAAAAAGVPELASGVEAVIDRAVAARCPVDIDAIFAAERAAITARYAALEHTLTGIGPAMGPIVGGNADRVRYQLDYLERKARQHAKRAERELAGALRAAAGRLFPGGGPQERHSLIYPHLFVHGPRFLDDLHEALQAAPGPFGRHWLFSRFA